MKQTVEEAARIEREKVIQELHVAYKMHKDPKHYIISNAAIQKYAVPLFKAGAGWQAKQSPWISVEERLPEKPKYDWVLVIIRDKRDGFIGIPQIGELRSDGFGIPKRATLSIHQISGGYTTLQMFLGSSSNKKL